MILIDTNIFMYAAGAPHDNKEPSGDFLRQVGRGEIDGAIDAEVLQEILHRYRAIGRWEKGRKVYDFARRIVPLVIPVTAEIMDIARHLMDEEPELLARDALHAAACVNVGAEGICSYDGDLDSVSAIQRYEPEQLIPH